MSKIPRRIRAYFPRGGVYKPKMHWLSLKELLGIWVKKFPSGS
jgi:hypothetical protein